MKETEMQEFQRLKCRLSGDANVHFALIFGSHAKGVEKPGSDLDLAAHFQEPPTGLELLDLINELSECAKKEVDLVVLNTASAFLRHQVMKNRIRLVVKDETVYRRFREKTMTDYDIYKFVSGMDRYDG